MKKLINEVVLLIIALFVMSFVACDGKNGGTGGGNNGGSTNSSQQSKGLEFAENIDGYYVVTGICSCTDTNVVIPSKYKSKPVKVIRSSGWKNKVPCKKIVCSDGKVSL